MSGPVALCRNDSAINFDWYSESPDPVIQVDHFSARWTRTVYFASGTYQFSMYHDDGARVYIDDVLVIDNLITVVKHHLNSDETEDYNDEINEKG